MKSIFCFVIISILFGAAVNAAECVVETERVPCPGREKEALDPYNSRAKTEEFFQVKSVEQCLQRAKMASKIVRDGTIEKKTVTARFQSQSLEQEFTDTHRCR